MANVKELDPGASPLHYFGAELRRLRDEAGLTLAQLGSVLYCTGSLIGQIETAAKTPTLDFVQRVDVALGADGALLRLWDLVKRSRLPYKQRRVAEFEESANQILTYQPQVVHGLLQTKAYAREVLCALSHDDLDAKMAGRLERQRILERAAPPLLWVVLGEAVLHHEVGGQETMRTQLLRLLQYRHVGQVNIQVLPFRLGVHAGLNGAFTLFSYEDQPNVAYAESYEGVEATVDPQEFRARSLRYDHLRAAALSPADSAELIARVMEERYERGSRSAEWPMA
ncbi:helix-turn-helix domain-containing protein [Streptomyces daliensis]|uniref:Helix-turn-helix domain-containing protein n=1 Tax=Streptomyces daliensis TaxID=299421 RepID=A0A8T4IYL9_9ACTN|nr:helix-turn-helix domain-containing protein [Streptomyces daliensis]